MRPAASNRATGAARNPWLRFFRIAIATAATVVLALFCFVAVIDPWDGLPLSPSLPRLPVTTSSRYAFPMLARSPRFDSAIIGTSTTRLLRPDVLDPLLHAHFVNLSIDALTAYEETRLLQVFNDAHPRARFIIIGLDANWCVPGNEQLYTSYPFPEWLYNRQRWEGYREVLNAYAVQEAGSQLWAMLGLKQPRHGSDGYSDFGVPEQHYDLARARANIAAAGQAPAPANPAQAHVFATHPRLANALHALPASTKKLLMFVPFTLSYLGEAGSEVRAYWRECKHRIAAIARGIHNTVVIDFMIPSPITRDAANYYDAIHYRPHIATRLARDLAHIVAEVPSEQEDYRLLTP